MQQLRDLWRIVRGSEFHVSGSETAKLRCPYRIGRVGGLKMQDMKLLYILV